MTVTTVCMLETNLVTMETTNRTGIILQSTVDAVTSPPVDEGDPRVESVTECPTDACSCVRGANTEPVINCKWKTLQSIPTFKAVNMIYYEIDFSEGNYIKSLPNDAFKNLKVKNINLLKNELTADIEPRAFDGLALYLEGLKIQGNGKIPIPFDRLSNLTNLKQLHIQEFQQSNASENSYFSSFPRLETLSLLDIHTLELDASTFDGNLPNLLHLELSNVYIDTIPVSSLRHLTGLQYLSIKNNNRLRVVFNNSFENLRNLKELSLSYNLDLEQIDSDAFFGISRSLTTLHLGSNNLNSNALQALSSQSWPRLTHLTLSYNPNLSPITGSVFTNMGSLQYLYMEQIGLKTVDQSLLQGLNNIFALNLGYNNIEAIADRAFVNTKMLSELHLHYQKIGTVSNKLSLNPNTFAGIQSSLKHLDLEATPLQTETFWEALKTLTELQSLTLRKTGVSTIPASAFHANNQLSQIDLQDNTIQDLPIAAFNGLESSLKEIQLENNQLTSISECIFRNFTRLNEIGLRGNLLDCGCKLVWLHRFLHEKLTDEFMYRKDDYVCSTSNTLLYDIPEDTLCSNIVTEDCSQIVQTTTTKVTSKPSITTPSSSYILKLSIPSRTSHSITLGWVVNGLSRSSVTGYKIDYYPTTDKLYLLQVIKHREDTFHVLENLQPGTFYDVCISVEIDNVWDSNSRVCQTTQTLADGSSKPQPETDNNNNNIIIGAVIATVVVVILISVGVCAVVKYKYRLQQLQQIPFTMNQRGVPPMFYGDEMTICAIPNEYVSAHGNQMGHPYARSPRMIHRQFGVDPDDSPYNTYHRIKIRRNPYENDDEGTTDEEVGMNNSQEILCKPDLVGRHSAPSRLDAVDLLKESERNSRPLPATPGDKTDDERTKARSHTLQARPGKKRHKKVQPEGKPNNREPEQTEDDDNDDTIVLGKDPIYSRANTDKRNET